MKKELRKHIDEIEMRLQTETSLNDGEKARKLIQQLLHNSKKNSSGFILSFISRNSKDMNLEDFEQMVSGIVKEETRKKFIKIVHRMQDSDNIQALILGCTELPLLFNNVTTSPSLVLKSTRLSSQGT